MRKLLRLLCMAAVLPVASSCGTDLFERYDIQSKDDSRADFSDMWIPEDCVIDEVALKSFSVKASRNPQVLSDLTFVYRNDSLYVATVTHYSLSDRKLVPVWNGVAKSVTVDGAEQVPAETEVDFSNPVKYRFHASDGSYREIQFVIEQGDCSGMPVAAINTAKFVSDHYTWIPASFRLCVPLDSTYCYDGKVKYLNDNSINLNRKSFDLAFENEISIMGMSASRFWNVVSNASDRTFVRTRTAYRIGTLLGMQWNPSAEYCELFVNGEYMGLYMLSETVEVGKDKVDLTLQSDDNDPEQQGYLFKADWENGAHRFRTAVMEIPINIVYPYSPNPQSEQYVYDYFKHIEQYLYQKELPDVGYRDLVDLESFAACWIAYEITACVNSTMPLSVWYYKKAGGKLCAGPLWNFDSNSFNSIEGFLLRDYETTDFNSDTRSLWYSRLFRDDAYVSAVKDVWTGHKAELLNVAGYVDSLASVISQTAQITIQKFPTGLHTSPDSRLPWTDAVDLLKSNYSARWTFLENNIMGW